ncbi:hypothetical protein ASG14_04885 [Pedobacter sp. Leaf194]|nr:hypothetical protein ASG14_04885 [Pedobacter sp. Leaf194]
MVLLLFWNYLLNRLRSTDRINIESLKTENEKLGYSIKKLTERNEYVESEMHHRIKNNLQILSSLINGQLSFANDKNGLEILYQTKYRLFALSLVHQKLFQHASSAVIEMSCCIKELADFLIDEFNCGKRVQFEMNLVSLKVDPTVAIPFAIIINELITNSLKFAFPGEREGFVKITLSSEDNLNYRLVYSDDGIGLPKGFDFYSSKTLGKTLIAGLSKQMKGRFEITQKDELEIAIDFKATIKKSGHFSAGQ